MSIVIDVELLLVVHRDLMVDESGGGDFDFREQDRSFVMDNWRNNMVDDRRAGGDNLVVRFKDNTPIFVMESRDCFVPWNDNLMVLIFTHVRGHRVNTVAQVHIIVSRLFVIFIVRSLRVVSRHLSDNTSFPMARFMLVLMIVAMTVTILVATFMD